MSKGLRSDSNEITTRLMAAPATGPAPDTAGPTGTIPLGSLSGADDLKAIEALTGTSGSLHKTAANTWALRQSLHTTDTPQFAGLGLGVAAHAEAGLYVLNTAATRGAIVTEAAGDISASIFSGKLAFQLLGQDSTYNFVRVASDVAAQAGNFLVQRGRGTLAVPTALNAGDNLGGYWFSGSYTGGIFSSSARIDAETTEAWSGASNKGTTMRFSSTITGSGTLTEMMRLSGAGNLLIGTTADTGLTGAGGLSIASTTPGASGAGALLVAGGAAFGANVHGTTAQLTRLGLGVAADATRVGLIDASGGALVVSSTAPGSITLPGVSNITQQWLRESASMNVQAFVASATTTHFPTFVFTKINGTFASPGAVTVNHVLGGFSFQGHNGSAAVTGADIVCRAAETWSGTAKGSFMDFATTPNGTLLKATVLRISPGGNVLVGTLSEPSAASSVRVAGALRTGTPSGGAQGEWKLGEASIASPVSNDRKIRIDIGGVAYDLLAVAA